MAILTTKDPGTARYIVWIGQTLSFAHGLAGAPPELCRGTSRWLQEEIARVACSVVGHEVTESDEPWGLEQVAAVNKKVILYAAALVEGRIKVDYANHTHG